MARPLIRGQGGLIVPALNGWQGQHLAVAIYWLPAGGESRFKNGHASLIIDLDEWFPAQRPSGATELWWASDKTWYVSWYGGQIDWAPKLGSKGGSKGVASDLDDDRINWGGIGKWVAVRGLDPALMKAEWDVQLNKGGGAHWRLTDKNCATMVHKILKAGGGNQAATAHKSQIIWWPTDIPKYARAMTRNGVSVFDHSDNVAGGGVGAVGT